MPAYVLRLSLSLGCLAAFVLPASSQMPPGTLTTIWNFSSSGESRQPDTGVIVGPNGVLYGTTWGAANLFSLTPPTKTGGSWTLKQLYAFPIVWIGREGFSTAPNGLAMDSNGVIYGTNSSGGILTGPCSAPLVGCGSVFLLTPPPETGGEWTETTLYTFTGGDDGGGPAAGVTIGPGGVLYGTAELKGASSVGTAFSLTPPAAPGGAWVEATLHTFTGTAGTDGSAPTGALAIDGSGILYGTTCYGGAANRGTVFSLTPPAIAGGPWTETILYSFSGGTDGSVPDGGVVLGPSGVLYGSTRVGGANNGGAVYALTPPSVSGGAWTEAVLYSFQTADSSVPDPGPLTFGPNGALYGTTYRGGAGHEGTVFALTPPTSAGSSWGYVEIYGLDAASGYYPTTTIVPGGEILAVGSGGMIFGTGSFGGTGNEGTVFELRP
ncbi:MAG TPA: choice-of-anchor tandem repeat GloVer-containing protein [Bryobacteraceae bacterium]|nr:choice-of-anchor tandem repeat GloVer-containing protein [Bryobacteraceae bacterium]